MKACLRLAVAAFMIFSVLNLYSASKKSTGPEVIEKKVGDISLVYIPAGSFRMGRDVKGKDYSPSRIVKLSRGFWIGRYEITQSMYRSITGHNPCSGSRYGEGDALPVFNVSWYDAVEFCNLLSVQNGLKPFYRIDRGDREGDNVSPDDELKWEVKTDRSADGFRLPTEAEWEYACMGGSAGDFYWGTGDSWDVSGRYAWHMFNSGQRRYNDGRFWWVKYHKVKKPGQKIPNRFGIYDISGNVAEWCFDRYSSSYYSEGITEDPDGTDGDFIYRVVRGGSILDAPRDLAGYKRWPVGPFEKTGTNGIRVVLPE